MAATMTSSQQPLRVYGIPVNLRNGNRPSGSSSSAQSTANLERLLLRVEKQLREEEEQAKDTASTAQPGQSSDSSQQDSSRAASIAIALTHASTQIVLLPPGPDVLRLQDRLESARRRYVTLHPLQQSKPKTRSRLQDYLVQDVVNDSDTDSEYEAELRESRAAPAIPLAGHSVDPEKGVSEATTQPAAQSDRDEDDELQEYEAAAGLRRRHGNTKDTAEVHDEEATEEAPPSALQSERSVQDALSGELLRMAGVLKTNSLRFADALERDRKVLEEAGEKLQGNLTLMTRTRGRLGVYSRKARSMGWITLGSVAVVCMSWVLMFIVIRLT